MPCGSVAERPAHTNQAEPKRHLKKGAFSFPMPQIVFQTIKKYLPKCVVCLRHLTPILPMYLALLS